MLINKHFSSIYIYFYSKMPLKNALWFIVYNVFQIICIQGILESEIHVSVWHKL